MSQGTNNNLPDDAAQLPTEAQRVYMVAFENAWKRYGMNPRDETRAHAIAWAAVKQQFHQDQRGAWIEGTDPAQPRQTGHIDDRRIF